MAKRNYIKGKERLLDISTDGGSTWKVAACIKTLNFSSDRSELSTVNSCTGDFTESEPDTITATVSLTGDMIKDATVGETDFQDLMELHKSGEIFDWKIYTVDGSYYRAGQGWISNDSEDLNQDGLAEFSVTINITGEYETQETT